MAQTTMTPPPMTVGRRLKLLRDRWGWTLADVERLTGGDITQSALSRYEHDQRGIPEPKLRLLCDLYRVTPNDVLGYSENGITLDQRSRKAPVAA